MSSVELGFDLVLSFLIASIILYYYGDWYRHHLIVTFSVLTAWYFSLIIVTVIPQDVSNAAYRQCLKDERAAARNFARTSTTPFSDFPIHDEFRNSTVHEESGCLKPGSYLEEGVLRNLWRVVYWSSQCLTWLVLPIMQSYTKAGEFTVKGKMKAALKDNIIYYGSYLFICAILLAYIAVKPGLGLSWDRLKPIVSSASNTWGLFLLVFMLGYGLVAIPRTLWFRSSKGYSLNNAYFKMAKLSADRNSAEEALDDALENLNSSMKSLPPGSSLSKNLETISAEIPVEFRERLSRRRVESPIGAVDQKYLVRLHRQIKSALQTYHRTETQWSNHITKTIKLEDIEKNSRSAIRIFKKSYDDGQKFIFGEAAEWYWHCVISNWLLKIASVMSTILSLLVVWSEATFFIKSPTISLFALFIDMAKVNYNYFAIEVISTCTIAYLCVCAYYTIFKIRIFNYYYLAGRHQTDEYSLIFAGMLLCRLTPPICLNFLGLIHMDSHVIKDPVSETYYTQVMGHLDVLSLISDGFNIYFPMGILIIGVLTYWRVGARLLNIVGFQQFLVEDEVTGELVAEGQQLITREKRRRQRQEEAAERRSKLTSNRNFRTNNIGGSSSSEPIRTEVTEEPSSWSPSPVIPIRDREQVTYGTPERRTTQPPRDLFDDV